MTREESKEHKDAHKKKMEWVATLKVGDIVEDCRPEICTIKEIQEDRFAPRWLLMPFWLYRILPERIARIEDWWENFLVEHGISKLSDKTLTMTDGRICSAFNCCDPVEK